MKKQLTVVFILIAILLDGCNYDKSNSTTTSPSNDNYNTPSQYETFDFNSYEDLSDFINQENQEIDTIQGNAAQASTTYQTVISETNHTGIPVPCYNEHPITLYAPSGFMPITMFVSELYNKPWIWYHTTIDDEPITVRTMLDQDAMNAFSENDSGSDIVKQIAPNAPNIENFENFEGYSSIYETDIFTANGTRTALIEETTDNWEYITFIQNGYLVVLSGPKDKITSEWLQGFSIMVAEVSNENHMTD